MVWPKSILDNPSLHASVKAVAWQAVTPKQSSMIFDSQQLACMVRVHSFVSLAQAECAGTLQGPYLHCAAVEPWGAAIMAHRKANDDHIQLVQVRGVCFALQ